MLKGFRDFLLRGNVIDLSVAVLMGAAFGSVISAFVSDLLTPLIAAIGGQPDFSALTFEINNSQFFYGDFLNALISFLMVGTAVYFLLILPVQKLKTRGLLGIEGATSATVQSIGIAQRVGQTRSCPECLSEIPIQAHRCAHCAQLVPPIPGSGSIGNEQRSVG